MGLIFLFFVIYSSVMGTGKGGMHAFLRSPFYPEFSLLKGLWLGHCFTKSREEDWV